VPSRITLDDFRRLADRSGADPDRTASVAVAAAQRLRTAWAGELMAEAQARFPALAEHYRDRLRTMPVGGSI
jgi:serine/threonine-protein kinase HipA